MKKFIATILMLSMPFSADAAMQDMLNKMFMSNVTTGGAFSTQNRAGYVGGSVQLRTPIKPITLMAFDPPRFSAGCGGLDMYGGAFSFINADQFTALVRQIMSNAIGLMFQAALKAINPMIADLVNYFQEVVNGLNKMSSNTCAIAHQLTDSMFDPKAKTTSFQDSWKDFAVSTGKATNDFAAKFASPAEQKANAKTAENSPEVGNMGNLTWRALRQNKCSDLLDFFPAAPTTADNNLKAEVIMSVLGVQINTQAGTAANETTKATAYDAVLTINDLLNESKSAETLKYLKCQAGGGGASSDGQYNDIGCPVVSKISLPFSGTMPYIQNMLYGDGSATAPATVLSNSINYSAGNPYTASFFERLRTGQTLNASQQNFLRYLPGPLSLIIMNAQSDPAAYTTIFPYIEKYAAYAMAERVGESILHASRCSWDGVKSIPKPQVVNNNIAALEKDMQALRAETNRLKDNVDKAVKIAQSVRVNNPNPPK